MMIDVDLRLEVYGWKMRLKQIEEDIFTLGRRRDKIKQFYERSKERLAEEEEGR